MNRRLLLLAFSWASLTTSSGCFISDYTPPTVDPNWTSSESSTSTSGSSSTGVASSSSGSSSAQSGAGGAGGASNTSSSGMGGAGGGNDSGGAGGNGGNGGNGGMPPVAFCDEARDSLLACFRFEDSIVDESGQLNVVSTSGVSFEPGKVGAAGGFTAASTSYLRIESADHWNVNEFTVEMWVFLRSDPVTGTRMGLFDSDGRYGFFILPGQMVRCTRGVAVVEWTALPLKSWTHVACKLAGATLSLHINGSNVGTAGGAMPPAANMGLNAIGGNAPGGSELDGRIDNFRIWSKPRTDKEICVAAGGSGC